MLYTSREPLFCHSELTEDLLKLASNRLAELRALQQSQPENIVARSIAVTQLEFAIDTFRKIVAIDPEYQPPTIQFDPATHAVGGLPQCAACLHKFQSWIDLRTHIERGNCAHLPRSRQPAPPNSRATSGSPATNR